MNRMEPTPETRARRLVDAARELTEQQARDLAREVSALAGRFGTKRRWLRAWEQAKHAADSAGRGDLVEALSNELLLAVLEASARAAEAKGRRVDGLIAELHTCHGATHGHEAVKRLHRVARKSLGMTASQRIAPSSLGAGGAALALLTHDLVGATDTYGADEQTVLLGPWRTAIGPELT